LRHSVYGTHITLAVRTCYAVATIFRLRNDLYCVEWGVKLYSLTHSQRWLNVVIQGCSCHPWQSIQAVGLTGCWNCRTGKRRRKVQLVKMWHT